MAQQWNYYTPPSSTANDASVISNAIQSAASRYANKQAAEKKEKQRELENYQKKNEESIKWQQDSMFGYTDAIAKAESESEYGILDKTYTMEDKKEFAGLSRAVANKTCGACTEQIARISQMKGEIGITKNFIENLATPFGEMSTDIENGTFDFTNNSSMIALRGVLTNKPMENRNLYSHGIRKLEDGSQELWITGPDISPNKGKEFVINSSQLSKAQENGGGIYASPQKITTELTRVADSMKNVNDNGEPGIFQEKWFNEETKVIPDPKNENMMLVVKTRNIDAARQYFNVEIESDIAATFKEDPASAIATWNTLLKKDDDPTWVYDQSTRDEASGDEIIEGYDDYNSPWLEKQALYTKRMKQKFENEYLSDFNAYTVVDKIKNPTPVEIDTDPNIALMKEEQDAFDKIFADPVTAMDVLTDLPVTMNGSILKVTGDDDIEDKLYDFSKKVDFIEFYMDIADQNQRFTGTAIATKTSRKNYRAVIDNAWEIQKKNFGDNGPSPMR